MQRFIFIAIFIFNDAIDHGAHKDAEAKRGHPCATLLVSTPRRSHGYGEGRCWWQYAHLGGPYGIPTIRAPFRERAQDVWARAPSFSSLPFISSRIALAPTSLMSMITARRLVQYFPYFG